LFGIIAQVLRGVAQAVEAFGFLIRGKPGLFVDGPGWKLGRPGSFEEAGEAAAEEL
jgi:hypothetical protein